MVGRWVTWTWGGSVGERRMLDFSLSNAFLSPLDTEHFHDSTPETSKDKPPWELSYFSWTHSPGPLFLFWFTSLKVVKQGARNAWNPAFILPAKLHALIRTSSISRKRHFLYTQCVSPSQVWRAVMAQRGAFSSFRWRQLLGNRWLCLPTGSPSSVLFLFLSSCSSPSSLFPQLPPISSPSFFPSTTWLGKRARTGNLDQLWF